MSKAFAVFLQDLQAVDAQRLAAWLAQRAV